MQINWDVNPADKAQGVQGYYIDIVLCKSCGKQTNLVYKSNGRYYVACSQECADKRSEVAIK